MRIAHKKLHQKFQLNTEKSINKIESTKKLIEQTHREKAAEKNYLFFFCINDEQTGKQQPA